MSFRDLWEKTNRPLAKLNENHNYAVGGDDYPEFVRIDEFDAAEPIATPVFEGPLPTEENPMPELTVTKRGRANAPLSPRRPARDEWKEWNKARRDYLLGGKRVARTGRGYTVFPQDEQVNSAILGCANKFIPANIDKDTGLPCEDFRDLCSYLAVDGVEKTVEGGYHWAHIEKKASAYLRKMSSHDSITINQLRNKGPRK